MTRLARRARARAVRSVHVQTTRVVKHEMIHDMLHGGRHDDTPLDDPLFECAAR